MSNETGEVSAVGHGVPAASVRVNGKGRGRTRGKKKARGAPVKPDEILSAGARQKAVDVTLRDGRHVYVREPKATEIALFLRAELVIGKMRDVVVTARTVSEGVIGLPMPEITERDMSLINPLLARLTGMPEAEINELGMFDWMGLLMSLYEFMPKNARRTTP